MKQEVPYDFKVFSTIAALSERILSVDEKVRPFMDKLDFTNATFLQYVTISYRTTQLQLVWLCAPDRCARSSISLTSPMPHLFRYVT